MVKKKDSLLDYRVRQLESVTSELDKKMEKLLENHIPHLASDIKSVRTEVRITLGVNLILTALAIIIAKFLSQ